MSSPSPPPPTPERADHDGRRNRPGTRTPRRQPVQHLGPPRHTPSNSQRQMTRLDVDWEVRRLERHARQQPEAFGRRPRRRATRRDPPASPESSLARSSASRPPGPRPLPTFEQIARVADEQRLQSLRRRQERRELRARAEVAKALTYDDARTMARMQEIPIIVLTLQFYRTPTLSTTPRQCTSLHSHY